MIREFEANALFSDAGIPYGRRLRRPVPRVRGRLDGLAPRRPGGHERPDDVPQFDRRRHARCEELHLLVRALQNLELCATSAHAARPVERALCPRNAKVLLAASRRRLGPRSARGRVGETSTRRAGARPSLVRQRRRRVFLVVCLVGKGEGKERATSARERGRRARRTCALTRARGCPSWRCRRSAASCAARACSRPRGPRSGRRPARRARGRAACPSSTTWPGGARGGRPVC